MEETTSCNFDLDLLTVANPTLFSNRESILAIMPSKH